jgi:hypothetical protein
MGYNPTVGHWGVFPDKKERASRDNVTTETVEHEKKQEKVLENRRYLMKY